MIHIKANNKLSEQNSMENKRGVVEAERLEKQSYSLLTISGPGIRPDSELTTI